MNAPATPPKVSAMFDSVDIDLVHESPWNPRKHWNAAADADLERSIREVGIITPLLVRQRAPRGEGYELAAGHRRLRAAKRAGCTRVPIQIREFDDDAFREILVIENLQRTDIHPLDEADAYQALLKADKAYTVEALAARVGKSTSYVYRRLKLAALAPATREAFLADELTPAHAERLARLPEKLQARALEGAVFSRQFGEDKGHRSPASVRELDAWIESNVVEAPVLTEDLQHYFPQFAEQLQAETEPEKIVQVSEAFYVDPKKHKGLPDRYHWKEIKGPKDRCEHVTRGAVVHGGRLRVLDVCVTQACKKHFPPAPTYSHVSERTSAKPSKAELERRAKEKREREAREAWRKVETKATAAFAAHLKATAIAVTPALVEAVIGDYQLRPTLKQLGAKKLTADNMAAALALFALDTGADTYDPVVFTKFAKPFGFDVGAWIKANSPKPAPAKKPAPKPAAKKAAKKR